MITIILRLVRPGGVRGVVAEFVLAKHQLLILDRSRQRAPDLRGLDRLITEIWIRALPCPARSVSYRFQIAMVPTVARVTVDPCTLLHAGP